MLFPQTILEMCYEFFCSFLNEHFKLLKSNIHKKLKTHLNCKQNNI